MAKRKTSKISPPRSTSYGQRAQVAQAKRRRQPKRPDLDIIIPVYGRPDLLEKCLHSIEATKGNLDINIILVDDQGPDQEALNELYGSLNGASRVIRNPSNSGFPKTVNTGLKTSTAQLILILNTDIELQPDALQMMIAEFDEPTVGVVAPKLLFPPTSTDPHRPAGKIQHAGLAIDFQARVIHPYVGWSAGHPMANRRRECQAVTGACLMTRRSVWQEALKAYQRSGDPTTGPFNEVYGRGTFEDVEYCFAVRSLDYKVIYAPSAVAYHYVGASAEGTGGYPLDRNYMIFKARCGAYLIWDEWRC